MEPLRGEMLVRNGWFEEPELTPQRGGKWVFSRNQMGGSNENSTNR
jgi:hypothetical protein